MFTTAHATVAVWCLMAAALLPIVCAAIAKSSGFGASDDGSRYDNHHPRAWLQRQQGWRARADAAQANGFENLPLFIGAVLFAQHSGGSQGAIDSLAAAYVAIRIAYLAAYLSDLATPRSMAYSAGLLVNLAIFFVA
jgi:uncharacterized MAPEG superfamily protein